MYMKNILSSILLGVVLTLGMSGCQNDFDDLDVRDYTIFSKTSVGEVNTTIADIKGKYCKSNAGATYSRSSSNWEFKIEEDLVFEGVVVSNDGPWGALYQQIILRSFEGANNDVNGINAGHCIQLGVKNTCLYPYFAIGQKLRINLKGLYVGVYSKTPKIGYPYFTSAGNHNLGPMPFEMCSTNIEKIGAPDPGCAECQPVNLTGTAGDAWLRATANRNYLFSPMLAKVAGKFVEANGTAILAPKELQDDGYAVDRNLILLSNSSKVIVRTSTGTELSNIVIPTDKVEIMGVLSYYDGWQIQFRDIDDMKVIE